MPFPTPRGVSPGLEVSPRLPNSRTFSEIVNPSPLGERREMDAATRQFVAGAIVNTAKIIVHSFLLFGLDRFAGRGHLNKLVKHTLEAILLHGAYIHKKVADFKGFFSIEIKPSPGITANPTIAD